MPKMHLKNLGVLCAFMLFFISSKVKAQEKTSHSIPIISFIQGLENKYDVKFSYIDEDIHGIQITPPETEVLEEILESIRNQTRLQIKKLSERYYTLTMSDTITICGIVLDNFEENTVAGATVEILESAITVITDEDGVFSLKNVPPDAMVQIKHAGYSPFFVNALELIKKDECKTLILAQFYQQLDEVVVYKFLTKGLVKKIDARIELKTEQFSILPGLIEPDVLHAVQALPGIKSIDETVSDINIRGGSNDQNLVLWDGIKMYQSGHFFGLISAFNPYLTDKVTVSKNGTSAAYGDGVSGVIDIETKNEITDTFFGGAGFNLISGDLYGRLPLSNKLSFQFSARRSLTDFLNTPTFEKFFEKSFQDNPVIGNSGQSTNVDQRQNFYFYDFTAKVLYDINPKQKLRLSFINSNNQLDYSQRSLDTDRETQSALDQTNLSFGGSLKSNWAEKFSTDLNVYYTRYNLDALSTLVNAQQQLFQNNKVIETAVKLNTNLQLNNTFNWLNGYQLNETKITNATQVTRPFFSSSIEGILKNHAFFSEVLYTSSDQKFYAQAGVRLNYFQNPTAFNTFIAEPRLNINYELTKSLKLRALGEFKSQAINQIIDLEQNFLGVEKRRWIVSDGVNLPITTSKQASLGLNYDQENLYLGLEGFYKEVEGISTTTQGFQNQNQFNGEIGSYNVKGIEFLINKKTDVYSIWASYAYNFNTYSFNTIIPPNFPNNLDIRHTATLAGTYTYKNLKLGLGLNYRTGRPFTQPLASDPIDSTFFPIRINYEEPNSSRLPEYLRADASAIYSFGLGNKLKALAGISVLNFTNRKNILNTYFQLNVDNTIETVENKSLGITPNFSFRVKF